MDIHKRYVKVDHDMTAEELLRLPKIHDPIFKRDRGINIYNDTHELFYLYRGVYVHRGNESSFGGDIILPLPKYYYSEEPKKDSVYASQLFSVMRITGEAAVTWLENVVFISKVQMNTEVTCANVIYNNCLDKEVTIEYLGSKERPVKNQIFTLRPLMVVVVEANSLIRVIG